MSVTIVSGLPRSGTSMVMRMLEFGGMELIYDDEKVPPDPRFNPWGHFESDVSWQRTNDPGWYEEIDGMGVKILCPWVDEVSMEVDCKVIFPKRDLEDTWYSMQQKGLDLKYEDTFYKKEPEGLKMLQERTLDYLIFKAHPFLITSFEQTFNDPLGTAEEIKDFLTLPLDTARMAEAVEPEGGRHGALRRSSRN